MARRGFTVIVIPLTGQRTVTFHMATLWAALAGALLLGGLAMLGVLISTNQTLKANLTEAQTLRRVNRLQQAEIEAMTAQAKETADKLGELQRLEQQVRELAGQSALAKTSRGEPAGGPSPSARVRGGPGTVESPLESLPSLTTLVPSDVSAHLFIRRDKLGLDLRQPTANQPPGTSNLAQAVATRTLLESQSAEIDQLADSLTDGKAAIADHLDYLAHRPRGLAVSGPEFTDRFGWRWSPFGAGRQFHAGLDMAQEYGTPIVATGAGIVTLAGWKTGGYGYAVVVNHGYGFETLYAHMSDWQVQVGQEVKRGTQLGWVGSTGDSTGPHLHYEVHLDSVAVDPAKYLD